MITTLTTAPARPASAWLVWALGASAFALAYFHRVAPSVMVGDLMRDLNVGAAVLGHLSAIYFYLYAGLQVPIGVIIDRWGPRRVLSCGLCIAALGSLGFALAEDTLPAYLGRGLIGAGTAVGFVATLSLAGRWFPPNRFAFVSGLTMAVAMVGAVLGQAPLAALVGASGWRGTMAGAAGFAALLAAAVWLVVRDQPDGDRTAAVSAADSGSVAKNLWAVIVHPQSWIVAVQVGLAVSPIFAYAALWGVPHLMQRYQLPRPEAAALTSLLLVGWAIGSPAIGWLSDRLGRRKAVILLTTAANLAGWCVVLYVPGLPVTASAALLFAIGLMYGGAVLNYAACREQMPRHLAGGATAFVNMAAVGGGALLQPLVGWLLDRQWDGTTSGGARAYALDDFAVALSVVPAVMAAALALGFAIREAPRRQPPSP